MHLQAFLAFLAASLAWRAGLDRIISLPMASSIAPYGDHVKFNSCGGLFASERIQAAAVAREWATQEMIP